MNGGLWKRRMGEWWVVRMGEWWVVGGEKGKV